MRHVSWNHLALRLEADLGVAQAHQQVIGTVAAGALAVDSRLALVELVPDHTNKLSYCLLCTNLFFIEMLFVVRNHIDLAVGGQIRPGLRPYQLELALFEADALRAERLVLRTALL